MPTRLRNIAIHVKEIPGGGYRWALIEQVPESDVWHQVDTSAESYLYWVDAWDVGCARMTHLLMDERLGPRVADKDQTVDPTDEVRHLA